MKSFSAAIFFFLAPAVLGQDALPNYLLVGGVDDSFNPFPTVEIMTPGGSCAGSIADMPVAAYGMSGAYLADTGMVQVCGGIVEGVQSSACYLYDPSANTWTEDTPMSGARAYGAFAQIGGKHLVVNGENDGGLFLETGEIFDGSAWSPLQDYPDNRELSCGARISDTAWMVSGGTGNNPKAVHSYDVDAGEWMEQPEMTLARFDHGCMAYTKDGVPGYIVSGGSSTPAPTATTEFFNSETQTWEILGNFALPRFGHSMAELNGLPTAIGGFFGDPTAQLVDGEWVDVPELAILLQKARFALVEVPSDVINCD